MRWLGLFWAMLVGAMFLWVLLRIMSGAAINADLIALLPGPARDPAVATAVQTVQDRAERQLLLLVGSEDADTAAAAAEQVRAMLDMTGLLVPVNPADTIPGAAAVDLAFRHRWSLLTDGAREMLGTGNLAGFERAVLQRYFSPGMAVTSDLVERDPLLLLPALLDAWAGDIDRRFTLVRGLPALQDGTTTWVLLQAELAASPFSFPVQDRLMAAIGELKAELATADRPVTLLVAGVLPHAAAGTASARREMAFIGTASLLGVVALLLTVFRSPLPLLLSAGVIAVGSLAGLAVTLALFGQVHLFTLIFGISLIGTAIDYAIHFFATVFRNDASLWLPQAALSHVLPGISLGLLTTTIGFGGLLLSGFPGLVQIACFSIAGLAAAWATTVLWVPAMARPRQPIAIGRLARLADTWLALMSRRRIRRGGPALLAFIALLAVWGIVNVKPLDDIRAFQAQDPSVVNEQARLQSIVGQSFATAFFLVRGRDAGELLEREEALGRVLKGHIEAMGQLDGPGLMGYTALSRFVPSPARQIEDLALLRRAVEAGSLERISARVGLAATAQTQADMAAAVPLTLDVWLSDPASAPFRHLWLGTVDGTGVLASVVLLHGKPDAAALAAVPLPDGVLLVDPVGDISAVFATYRTRGAWLILASYLVVAVVLMVRYGPQDGLRVLAVPLVAGCTCLALFGLAGGVSLFHQMALLLVLGMGVDYGLFLREAGQAERSTLIAVALSALTTFLAFGLLALSDTAAISAFGQTVAVGIVTAFLVSPIAIRPQRRGLDVMESISVE